MASKTFLVILALGLIAVAMASFEQIIEAEMEQDLSEELTVADFEEYFTSMQVEKRGRKKVGKCKKPDGKPCALCNLKIKAKNDIRRYIACSQAGNGRKI